MSDIIELLELLERSIVNYGREHLGGDRPVGADYCKRAIEEITCLRAENERLRGEVASAYREGFFDGGDKEPAEQLYDDWQKCWPISAAFKALQETGDE